MITIDPSVYSCRMIISLGDRNEMSISKKQEMWDIWKQFRKNIFKHENLNDMYLQYRYMTDDILKSTYNLDNYEKETMIDKWGCSSDVETHHTWVVFDKKSIYYPIEFDFHSFESPPLKWCNYMKKKGFMITLYFLDSNIDALYEGGQCGKCIYDNKKIIEELYTVPTIDYIKARNVYQKDNSNNENWKNIRSHIYEVYELEGFCPLFIIFLEENDGGPAGETCMLLYKMHILNDLDILEDKLENGEINEGEYIEECNDLRKEYDETHIGSF